MGYLGLPKKYNILFFMFPGFITLTLLDEKYNLGSLSRHNLKICLEFHQPDLQWSRGALVTRMQQPNRKADHSSVGTVTHKERRNYTSTPNNSSSYDA
jgi:hypothetical protein